MLCYRDRSYCQSDCVNESCSRFISEEVKRHSKEIGLPLCLVNFIEGCEWYQAPEPKEGEQ